MLKVFAFVFLVFSQHALADSDEVYHCGKNTYQSMPCAYTKTKAAADKQAEPEKTTKNVKNPNALNKPKPLAMEPKVEPLPAPTKPVQPIVTKKPAVAAPPALKSAPKPAPKQETKPVVDAPVSKPPATLPEPAPVKAPEPVTAPEPVAPPVAEPEPIQAPVAEPEKTEEAPPKSQTDLGVCDSLKAGLDNIENQKKSGAGDAADLNRQQKELEKVMKQSGC